MEDSAFVLILSMCFFLPMLPIMVLAGFVALKMRIRNDDHTRD